jgi:alanine racemase
MSTASDQLERFRPTFAEVDLDAFGRNVGAMKRRLPDGTRLVAVLKADGYGHGAVELGRRTEREGVAMIGVALLEEALELRRAGIDLPILVLGPLSARQLRMAAAARVTVGIVGPEELALVAQVASQELPIHLKLDSGMGRLGTTEGELPQVIDMLRANPRIRVEAVYTHFASAADPSDPFTQRQIEKFEQMVATLKQAGIGPVALHLANSAAAVRGIVAGGDYVRVGIALYGAEPLDSGGYHLEPVMRWRTEIMRLKTLPSGHGVGYGISFVTSGESRIATLPVGYADGYPRLLSNHADVLVRGTRAPVVGRVSMDLLTIDVTGVPDAAVGDEVVLLGSQGSATLTAEELAARTGTISYEVFCRISARVPRVYRRGGEVAVSSRFTGAVE